MDYEKVGIAGLGLIGTSIAQGIVGSFARTVVGYDPDRAARTAAATSVTATTNRLDDLRGASLIVLAAPPTSVPSLVAEIASWEGDTATVTDVASVKGVVAHAVPASMRARFVPGHPMAGHESTGSQLARADMFHGAHWVLCPFEEVSSDSLAIARDLVRHLRALPVFMAVRDHDRHVALFSHLPHVLANVLLLRSLEFDHTQVHGGSWNDFVRVGGSNPTLWADILVANKAAVVEAIDAAGETLSAFRSAIERGETDTVAELIEQARTCR